MQEVRKNVYKNGGWFYLKSITLLGLVPSENKIKIYVSQGLILTCESMDDSNEESFSQSHLNCL